MSGQGAASACPKASESGIFGVNLAQDTTGAAQRHGRSVEMVSASCRTASGEAPFFARCHGGPEHPNSIGIPCVCCATDIPAATKGMSAERVFFKELLTDRRMKEKKKSELE